MYNWQHKNWAKFRYDEAAAQDFALILSHSTGEISGVVQGLETIDQQNALIKLMIEEAINTSSIEGEMLSRQDVMSSIRNNLGLNKVKETVRDKRAQAAAGLMIDVRKNYNKKLSETLIRHWHKLLFDGSKTINAGKYRTGKEPMQVISGIIGRKIVHFEAPPSSKVPDEMKDFVKWYNDFKTANILQTVVKTAISHLYFESIHPFEDGNGRIGRAIAEKCLSESLGRPVLLSLSSVIEKKRKDYYAALKKAQSSLAINDWIIYFADLIVDAQQDAVKVVQFSLKRTKFFDKYKAELNSREQKVLRKMLDAGADGFVGGMSAKKYISITKSSKATATRDLQHLTELGALILKGSGRSAHYELGI